MGNTTWFLLCLLTSAGVTYLVRMVPLVLMKKKITNRFLRSFHYYVPYVTLAVMTFPAIITATANPLSGLAALLVGLVIAWRGGGLFPVAVACCVAVYAAEWLL